MKFKYWRLYKSRGISKKDKLYIFQWGVAAMIFLIGVIIYFSWFFVRNCIIHWPVRFDVKLCWNEQIKPVQQKAGEAAGIFIP